MSDWLTTDCARCDDQRATEAYEASGNYSDLLVRRMILCLTCGNKRCPKATWHGNECTGSNDPNQAGSDYHFGVIPR